MLNLMVCLGINPTDPDPGEWACSWEAPAKVNVVDDGAGAGVIVVARVGQSSAYVCVYWRGKRLVIFYRWFDGLSLTTS